MSFYNDQYLSGFLDGKAVILETIAEMLGIEVDGLSTVEAEELISEELEYMLACLTPGRLRHDKNY